MLASAPFVIAASLALGALGEELGWRGYALPRLIEKQGPWRASLTLGVLWTLWHLPMTLLMGGSAHPVFMPLTAGTILIHLARITAQSGIMTFVYWHTGGSVLIAILLHLAFKTPGLFFTGLPPVPPDTQQHIYLINVALLCVVAVASLGLLSRRRSR